MNPINPLDDCSRALNRAEAPIVKEATATSGSTEIVDESCLIQIYRLMQSALTRRQLKPLEQVLLHAGAGIFKQLAKICDELAPADETDLGKHKVYLSRTASLASANPVELAASEAEAVPANLPNKDGGAEATSLSKKSARRSAT